MPRNEVCEVAAGRFVFDPSGANDREFDDCEPSGAAEDCDPSAEGVDKGCTWLEAALPKRESLPAGFAGEVVAAP
ncbi:MAG: hypothetical protein AAGF31_05245 [Planctomycetota bacterium]